MTRREHVAFYLFNRWRPGGASFAPTWEDVPEGLRVKYLELADAAITAVDSYPATDDVELAAKLGLGRET